jgi:hypothetical protein
MRTRQIEAGSHRRRSGPPDGVHGPLPYRSEVFSLFLLYSVGPQCAEVVKLADTPS